MDYENLVIRGKEGEKGALEEIIKGYMPYIIKWSKRIYINGYNEEDLIQLGCLIIMESLKNFDGTKGNFTKYITRILDNKYKNLINRAENRSYNASLDYIVNSMEESYQDYIAEDFSIEDNYIKEEQLKDLRAALDKLSPLLYHIIDYVYIKKEGTLKGYGEEKNIPYSTLKLWHKEALKKLRWYLER